MSFAFCYRVFSQLQIQEKSREMQMCDVKSIFHFLVYYRRRAFRAIIASKFAISDSKSSQRVMGGQEKYSKGGNRRRERSLPP